MQRLTLGCLKNTIPATSVRLQSKLLTWRTLKDKITGSSQKTSKSEMLIVIYQIHRLVQTTITFLVFKLKYLLLMLQ